MRDTSHYTNETQFEDISNSMYGRVNFKFMKQINNSMLMKESKLIWLLFFCFSYSISVFAQSVTTENNTSVSGKVNSIMNPLVSSNNYAGNVLIIKKGSTIFSESYGMMDEENQLENSKEIKFFLASASMIFTSAAIMKLVDEGRISTTDNLAKFFPNYKNGDQITIHHMLAQRSGIPAWDGGMRIANFNRNKPHTTAELIEYFKDDELLFEPGSDYSHGRSEYILLVAIIEKISRQSFEDYLRESIFEPLSMHNSGHYSSLMTDDDIPSLANGYMEKGFTDVTAAPKIHWSVKTGHASIYSTVEDMRKFADAVLNKELLSKESWDAILTNHGNGVGYGWFLSPQEDHKRFQMNGRSPGFSSYFGIYPDDDLIVIMLSNRYVSLPFFIGPKLAAAVLGDTYESLKLTTQEVDKSFAKRITGHYKMGPHFYRPNGTVKIKYKNGKVYSGSYPLIPVLDDEGTITGFVHRHYWSRLEFATDQNGKTTLHFDNFKGQKQGFINEWKWVILGTILVVLLVYFIWNRKVKLEPFINVFIDEGS